MNYAVVLLCLCAVNSINTTLAIQNKLNAAWTILLYIEADNNLFDDAQRCIKNISPILTSSQGINLIVQMDTPKDRLTWRYKITPEGTVNAGTLSSEMGYDPSTELFNAMQWAFQKYPAQHYAVILKNHGTGILDFAEGFTKKKGILYDDSQNTCLTNSGLTNALTKIKQFLHKKIDLVAMDACLMAMIEVAYQIKDTATLFVASEEVSHGFPYAPLIKTLSNNPYRTSPLQLAEMMVTSYKNFYATIASIEYFTLSTMDLAAIELLGKSINTFTEAVTNCGRADMIATKKLILKARDDALSFEIPDFIDLHSFFSYILKHIKSSKASQTYQKTLHVLAAATTDCLKKIRMVAKHNATGPRYAGAQGIAIYYPNSGRIHPSYYNTTFTKQSSWLNFITMYRE